MVQGGHPRGLFYFSLEKQKVLDGEGEVVVIDGRVQFSGRWGKGWVASECASVLLGPVSKEVRELAAGCAQAWELGDRFCPAALAPEDPESNSAISRTKRGPGLSSPFRKVESSDSILAKV